jgi:hypothetical protein
MQPLQSQRPTEKAPMPASAPAAVRLLDYFGAGAGLAVLPNGMVLAVQADHLVEVVRLEDIRGAARASRA